MADASWAPIQMEPSLTGITKVRILSHASGTYPDLFSLTSFIMFITVPTRTSTAIESLKVDLLQGKQELYSKVAMSTSMRMYQLEQ